MLSGLAASLRRCPCCSLSAHCFDVVSRRATFATTPGQVDRQTRKLRPVRANERDIRTGVLCRLHVRSAFCRVYKSSESDKCTCEQMPPLLRRPWPDIFEGIREIFPHADIEAIRTYPLCFVDAVFRCASKLDYTLSLSASVCVMCRRCDLHDMAIRFASTIAVVSSSQEAVALIEVSFYHPRVTTDAALWDNVRELSMRVLCACECSDCEGKRNPGSCVKVPVRSASLCAFVHILTMVPKDAPCTLTIVEFRLGHTPGEYCCEVFTIDGTLLVVSVHMRTRRYCIRNFGRRQYVAIEGSARQCLSSIPGHNTSRPADVGPYLSPTEDGGYSVKLPFLIGGSSHQIEFMQRFAGTQPGDHQSVYEFFDQLRTVMPHMSAELTQLVNEAMYALPLVRINDSGNVIGFE
jgi:hypothetical protein